MEPNLSITSLIIGTVSLLLSFWALYKDQIILYLKQRRKKNYENIPLKDIYTWLCKYYNKKKGVVLYTCSINHDYIIPFIIKKEWLQTSDIKSIKAPFLKLSKLEKKSTLTRRQSRLIDEKISYWGQTLFNGKTLCICNNANDDDAIHYTEVSYFDLAGCIIEYENETFKAIRNPFSNTPLRDRYLVDIQSIMDGTVTRRISMGGSVVVCMRRSSGGYNILLHTRSNDVVTARGAKSIIPQFGFESISKKEKDLFSEEKYPNASIVVYNIIKEFVEELYNYEELIMNIGSKKTMGKFSDIEEVKLLLDLYSKDLMRIIYLGHGFEMLIGTKILSFLMIVEDEKISEQLISQFDFNWEIDESGECIEMIDLTKPGIKLLDNYQKNYELTSSSSFALSQALLWLKENNYLRNR